jgi:glutamyl-Q tRNA(Asp) synthetase
VPVLRFAPSPNGPLHLGHGLSALLNAEAAKRLGARLLLRIEDIDRARSTEANVAGLLADCDWLGLPYERPPIRQSERVAEHRATLDQLIGTGLVYRCFASRAEITAAVAERPDWPRDPDGSPLYPGLWRAAPAGAVERALAEGRPFAWRLDMAGALEHALPRPEPRSGAEPGPAPGLACGSPGDEEALTWTEFGFGRRETIAADPSAWGDVVLARKDIPTSYHLGVIVDDAAQGVTHVLRGRDLFAATSVHVLLQRLLGLPTPLYLHHRLILGPDGKKLAKSRGSASLRTLIEAGARRDNVLAAVAWAPDADLAGLG